MLPNTRSSLEVLREFTVASFDFRCTMAEMIGLRQPRQSPLGISELKPGRVEEVAFILDPGRGNWPLAHLLDHLPTAEGSSSVSVTSSLILRKGGTARAQRELD